MPRIPIYGEHQVSTSGLPGVPMQSKISQEDALLFAGGTDVANLAKMTNAVADAAMVVQEKDDRATVMQHTGVMSLAVAEHHAKLATMTGAEAKDIAKVNKEFWDQYEAKSSESLTGQQRMMFSPVVARMKASSYEDAIRMQAKGVDDYMTLTTVSTQESAAVAARETPVGSEVFNASLSTYKGAVADRVRQQKLTGPAADTFVRQEMSKFHEPIITKMIEEDANAAKSYYYGNIKEISLDQRDGIEKKLKTGGLLQGAQQKVDDIYTRYGDYTPEGLAEIRSTLSGEEEKAAVDEFNSRRNDDKAVKDEAREKTVDSLVQQARKLNWNVGKLKLSPGYMALDDQGRENFDRYVQQQQDHARAQYRADVGFAQSQVDRKEVKAREKAADLHDANYANWSAKLDANPGMRVDFYGLTGQLSAAQIDALRARQERYRSGDKAELTDASVRSTTKRLAESAKVNDKYLWGLHTYVEKELTALKTATGRSASQQDMERIINDGLREVQVPGRFFGTNTTRAYNVDPSRGGSVIIKGQSGGVYMLDQIPLDVRREIVSDLRSAGVPETPDAIINAYNKFIQGTK